MKVDIGNNNEQSVYYNKARLEYANDGNVININYKIAKYDNKIKAICNIIAIFRAMNFMKKRFDV